MCPSRSEGLLASRPSWLGATLRALGTRSAEYDEFDEISNASDNIANTEFKIRVTKAGIFMNMVNVHAPPESTSRPRAPSPRARDTAPG